MNSYVLGFQEIDTTQLAMVGGKGANLGELSRIDGIRVPDGFCVTTEAYKRITGQIPAFRVLLEQLSLVTVEDRERIREISGQIRSAIEGTTITEDIEEAVTSHLTKLGEKSAYAVRSSATAEDLPMASFAGQQDTYLNIIGTEAILKHISKCWASLFTERAGKRKAKKTKKMISVLRNFGGFREYPKYALMQRFYVYKQAFKKEAAMLVQKGVMQEPEDIIISPLRNSGRLPARLNWWSSRMK